MSSVQAQIWNQQSFVYAQQSSIEGGVAQRVGFGTVTAQGAADGTTFIDVHGVGDSGTGDTYNGQYWVEMLSGTAKGEWKRIVDDNGSGTLTLENNGFSAQIDVGDEYAIWLMPESNVVKVTASSGETNMEDNVNRTEADDFWNGYWAVPISGARRGQKALVTDFTSSGGVFILAAGLGGALTIGDTVMLYKPVEVGNVSPGFSQEFIAKLSNRTNFSKGDGIVGAKGSGPITFETEVIPSGTQSADTVAATRSVISGLFQAAGLEEQRGTSSKISGSGSAADGSDIDIDTGTHENFKVGSMVCVAGNYSFVTSKTDGVGAADTLALSPSLPMQAQDTDAVTGTCMYETQTDGDFYGVNITWEVDEVRHTFFSCKGNVELSASEGKLMLNWSFTYDHYVRELETMPVDLGTAYSTVAPVLTKDSEAYLDTTQVDITGFTATAGVEVVAREVSGRYGINGVAGTQLINQNPGGTFQSLLEASGTLDAEDLWLRRTAKIVAVTWGSHANGCAVRMPVARLIEAPHIQDMNGMIATPYVFEAQDAGRDSVDSRHIADFTIHIA